VQLASSQSSGLWQDENPYTVLNGICVPALTTRPLAMVPKSESKLEASYSNSFLKSQLQAVLPGRCAHLSMMHEDSIKPLRFMNYPTFHFVMTSHFIAARKT